jgi:hypothetical protein
MAIVFVCSVNYKKIEDIGKKNKKASLLKERLEFPPDSKVFRLFYQLVAITADIFINTAKVKPSFLIKK